MKKRHTILYGRIAYSLIIAAVYFIGCRIPIPWNTAGAEQGIAGVEALLGGVTGEGQTGLTLLSLGLTPWICASIFVQVLSPLLKRTPGDETAMRSWLTAVLTLVFAVGLAVIEVQDADLLLEPGMAGVLQKAAMVILLTAGAFSIVWLARRNEVWGIGGQKLLIVMNLTETLWNAGASAVSSHSLVSFGIRDLLLVVCGILLLILIVALTVLFQKREYRYPVHRLMIDSRYAEDDYLAVRYNPAGTMPVMYTMALFSMLGTYVGAWIAVLPDSAAAMVTQTLALNTIPGLILFLILFRILTEVSAVFTIDPSKTADDLQRSGSYLEGIRKRGRSERKRSEQDRKTRNIHPGKETEGFLRDSIRHASNVSAAVMGGLILLPLAFGILSGTSEEIGSIPATVILLTGMLIELIEEGGMYYAMQEYRPILKVSRQRRQDLPEAPEETKSADREMELATCYVKQEGRPVLKTDVEQWQPKKAKPTRAFQEPVMPENFYFVPGWGADEAVAGERSAAAGVRQTDVREGEKALMPAVPVYDDTVHQLKMFNEAGEQTELVLTSYLPELRHFLHHHGLENVLYWSALDELQGITLKKPAVLLWQDLDWTRLGLKGSERNLVWTAMNGVMHGYLQERLVFCIHFTADGTVYYVDHYDEKDPDGRLDRRSIYDDRGFLSSSIRFKPPGKKPSAIQDFYNPEGDLQFEITYPSGRVTRKAASGMIGQPSYPSAEAMVLACQEAHLSGCTGKDAVFLAAKGGADDILRESGELTKQGQKLILSFYGKRRAELLVEEQSSQAAKGGGKAAGSGGRKTDGSAAGSGRKTEPAGGEGKTALRGDKAGESIRKYRKIASMIITDSERTRELIEQYVDKCPVADLYPCEMDRRYDRSGSTAAALNLFMPADWMFAANRLREARHVIKHIEYLMKQKTEIYLLLGTEKGAANLEKFQREKDQWFEEYRRYKVENAVNHFADQKGWRWIQDARRTKEMRDAEEEVRSRREKELLAMHKRIGVVSCQTEEELDLILDSTALVVDPRSEPDLRLQLASIRHGIPQVVCASSRYIRHTENGYLCANVRYLESGLHYYLDGLYNRNRSQDVCAQMMQEFSEEARLQTVSEWKKQIAKGVQDHDD